MLLATALLLAPAPTPPDYLGTWKSPSGDVIHLEEDRCAWLEGESATFYRARYEVGRALLERWARPRIVDLRLEGEELFIGSGSTAIAFQRIDDLPRALGLPPLEIATDVELDTETIAALREDLEERGRADQNVRKPGGDMERMRRVDEENVEALLGLIAEVGWIDAARFGPAASDAAFLIVQHSGHLRLMKTALPLIENEMHAGHANKQSYALLYDRLQVSLGKRQRYGSQLGVLPDGRNALMPLEDPDQVDKWRAEMGMGPLAEYLAYFEDDGVPAPRLEEIDLFADE